MKEFENSAETSSAEPTSDVASAMKADLYRAIEELKQEVRLRAYEIYCGRDKTTVAELDDWLRAEQEIRTLRARKRLL
jgi:hypothetical protein